MERQSVKISVLVPVYGAERYIRRCAESLFRQTMTEGVEFIFVDDASPDGSARILREVMAEHPEADAHIVSHEQNSGVAAARHTAIAAARGEYVAFVDSDDYVDPEYLELLYKAATQAAADVVFSNVVEERKIGSSVKNSKWAEGYDDNGIAILLGENTVYLCTKLIRRSLYTEHPECIAPAEWKLYEDYYSSVRLCHFAKKLAHTGEAHYHYDKTNEASLSHLDPSVLMEWTIRFWQSTCAFFAKEYPDGRYTEVLAQAKVQEKAERMLFHNDMKARRRYADLYRGEEGRHMWKLSRGVLAMAILVRYHLWPLVSLYSRFVEWRQRRAHKK